MKKLYIFLGIGAIGAVAYFKSKNAQASALNLQPLNAPLPSGTTPRTTSSTPAKMVTVSSSQPSVASQLAADQQGVQDAKDQEGWDALGGIGGNAQ